MMMDVTDRDDIWWYYDVDLDAIRRVMVIYWQRRWCYWYGNLDSVLVPLLSMTNIRMRMTITKKKNKEEDEEEEEEEET